MALTPRSLRLDLKCGNGAISEGEKCHVGAAKKVSKPSGSTTRRVAKAAKAVGEFVGPDLAAELLMSGAGLALAAARRRRSRRPSDLLSRGSVRAGNARRLSTSQRRAYQRSRYRGRSDSGMNFIPTQYIDPARQDL